MMLACESMDRNTNYGRSVAFQYQCFRKIGKLGMSFTQILVVDDFLAWQQLVSIMLQGESDLQIISSVTDGLEAVRKAKEIRPDLILMDLSLPVMNGIDATRQIRAHSPGTKVLFLSEHRDSDLIQSAFDVGALGYVLKSDSNADLIAGIRSVLLGQSFLSRSLTKLARESERRVLGAAPYNSADGN
jgi:DNA-binding NarL/FixJ family response regulator